MARNTPVLAMSSVRRRYDDALRQGFVPIVSAEEYERRARSVVAEMQRRAVDVIVIDEVEHLAYLFGYSPTAVTYQTCCLTASGDAFAIVRELDEPTFLEQSWVRDYVTFADWENPIAFLVDQLDQRGWSRGRIGQELDSHYLLVGYHTEILQRMPDVDFRDFSKVLWEQRLVKSSEEIALLQTAARVADAGILAGARTARVGATERDVAAAVSSAAFLAGADNTRIALLAAGTRSGNLHGRLGDGVLASGELLHLELVPHVAGYSARIMRPVGVGGVAPSTKHAADELIEIQDLQIAAMIPGASAAEVDAIARTGVIESGLRDRYPNTTGYTLGLVGIPRTTDVTRSFLPNADWELEENMTFHMYVAIAGMAFSETVQVAPGGGVRLTRAPRRLLNADDTDLADDQ